MKKIAFAFILIMLLLVFVSCEKESLTAEQSFINAMEAVKKCDTETLGEYLEVRKLIGSINDSSSRLRCSKIFEGLEYKVLSIKDNGDNAVVDVEIKNTDMSLVLDKYVTKSKELTSKNEALGDKKLSDKAMRTNYSNLFVELIEESENTKTSNEVNINLHKTNGQWTIEITPEFRNSIYGNLLNAQQKIENW